MQQCPIRAVDSMCRSYLIAVVAFLASVSVTALSYNFILWHYFRGYNEVSNMLVLPVVVGLVVVNVVAAGTVWLYRRWRKQTGISPLIVAFLLASLVALVSPLYAPSIGRYANRNLWIETPLVEAALYGDAAVVIVLLKHGADPNQRQSALGTTPLHYMAYGGKTEAVELLLGKGADPNAKANTSLETPLHWAVEARTNLPTIRTLIKYGAMPTSLDWKGKTPIDYTDTIPEPEATEIREAMESKVAK
jgi:hypothetical protein